MQISQKGTLKGSKIPIEKRFWSKVRAIESNSCWWWEGSTGKGGYGRFAVVTSPKAVLESAHRVSFMLFNGYMPKIAMHTCDNPSCVNPSHIVDGDRSLNAIDSINKNRSNAKLKKEQVLEIRNRMESVIHLAKEYGVNRESIYRIKKRQRWAHI